MAARDRFGTAAGWVRVDGAPVAANVASWLTGNEMYNPIATNEHGDSIEPAGVWTGTRADGSGPLVNCQDWTDATINQSGAAGIALGAVGDLTQFSVPTCVVLARVYCFEIDRVATVGPARTAGRRAFVTGATRPGGPTGLSGMDQSCVDEALAAGLGGMFRAAVATTTSTIRSRFTLDARPWVRVDGTVIAVAGAALFSGPLASFVNPDAAGNYQSAYNFIWTGATCPDVVGVNTCNDWTSVSAAVGGTTGRPGEADPAVLWNQAAPGACNGAGRVLCLEI
jgi:hypothetical protein